MGLVRQKDTTLQSLRIKCILRSTGLSHPAPCSNPPDVPLKPGRKREAQRPPTLTECAPNSSFVMVEGEIFEVHTSFFQDMTPQMRHELLNAPGVGESRKNPVLLQGPTSSQFQILLYAFTNYATINIQGLTLDQLLSISEWAFTFGLSNLKSWSLNAMASLLVPKANSPLRTASNVEFLRAMRLAVVHRRHDISGSIQTKWLTRILWHELSPMPAILFADRHEFRGLLSHAYYTHMVELGDRLDRGIYSDESSPLNRRQKTHLLAGHHSISTYWKHLRVTPPSFPKGPRCKLHKQCTAAWTMRWSVACSRPCSIAGTDVLRRLRLVEDTLRVDTLLQVCLAPECLVSALNSISQKRMEISNGLHHHFDLP